MKASIIVLNFNGRKWLDECLSSILKQEFDNDFEVILVDNGSTDNSLSYVEQKFPTIKIVKLAKNHGFAEGNNIGLKHAKGDYLVFVNMDTKAEDDWLKTLVAAADRYPEYRILCSIQLPSQNVNRARILNSRGHPMPSPRESNAEITDSLFASGACFIIRKSLVNEIGYLFDPFYFSYAEDLELSLRMVLLGGQIGYVRDSRIVHYGGGAGLPSFKAAYLSMRNLLLTYYKLFDLANFVKIFFVQTAYVATRFFARTSQTKTTLGMIKGFFGFLQSFHHYNSYRKTFLKRKKRSDKYVLEKFLYNGKMEKLILKKALYGC